VIWALTGLVAFAASLFCFARSGTIIEKATGLAVSVLTGPFFFAYYASMRGYCRPAGKIAPL